MSTQFLHHRSLFVALPVIVGLIAVGCSDSTSKEGAADTTDATVVVDTDVSTSTSPPSAVVTTTTYPTPAPTPTPTPGATLADPPVASTIPPISLAPGVTVLLKPTITSLTATKTQYTCAQAVAAKHVGVSWTTSFASSVTMQTLTTIEPGKPANGSVIIPLVCGQNIQLKFVPVGANGVKGTSKLLNIVVDN